MTNDTAVLAGAFRTAVIECDLVARHAEARAEDRARAGAALLEHLIGRGIPPCQGLVVGDLVVWYEGEGPDGRHRLGHIFLYRGF